METIFKEICYPCFLFVFLEGSTSLQESVVTSKLKEVSGDPVHEERIWKKRNEVSR